MFYSKTTGGFYNTEIHGDNIPSDAVEITSEQHLFLMDGQAQGKQIVGDNEGNPILVDAEVIEPTTSEKRASEYPFIGDQLDMLWHAIDTGTLNKTSDFYTTLKSIKDKYPKN